MNKVLIANWKMHPETLIDAEALFHRTVAATEQEKASVVVCPPFEYLLQLIGKKKSVMMGAQDVFWENVGPYTGEVSPTMLENAGITHVIIGHSERRKWLGETDEMVHKKVRAALAAHLTPIICVGESREIRDSGLAAAQEFVLGQVREAIKDAPADDVARALIAYEPIWAISGNGGTPDDPDESARMCEAIARATETYAGRPCRVLYGGSVTAANLERFLTKPEINGALVGGASLRADEFAAMIATTAACST